MKIVSWNCNGKFREKYKYIQELDADIYVIQECENPALTNNKGYKQFAHHYLWQGETKNKGLGIFAKSTVSLQDNQWPNHYLRDYISARVNNQFNLLAIWAKKPYIENYCVYQSINIDQYQEDMIIIGDLNSNQRWDKKHGERSHSNVVASLKKKNLQSAYHYLTNEAHGKESQYTYYMYRHLDKGYHIDYAFLQLDNIKHFQILHQENWLIYSDHLPLILETKT